MIKAIYKRDTKEQIDLKSINLNKISRNNNFMCEYECSTCKRTNLVTFNVFTQKVKKQICICTTCSHTGKQSLVDKLSDDNKEFKKQSIEFKRNYFRKYLTPEEFTHIKNHMKSFQHEKFTNLDDFEYYPCVKTGDPCRYLPFLYDTKRDALEKIININFCCETCGEIFFNRELYAQKNKYKILCSSCGFTNNTFKLKNTINYRNEKVTYKSLFEKRFIDFCNDNKIVIRNDSSKFLLPDLNMSLVFANGLSTSNTLYISAKTYAISKEIILKCAKALKTNKI